MARTLLSAASRPVSTPREPHPTQMALPPVGASAETSLGAAGAGVCATTLYLRGSEIRHSPEWVRRKMSPSEMTTEELVSSSKEFVASSSN